MRSGSMFLVHQDMDLSINTDTVSYGKSECGQGRVLQYFVLRIQSKTRVSSAYWTDSAFGSS